MPAAALRPLFGALPEEQQVLVEDLDDVKSQKALVRILKRHGLGEISESQLSKSFQGASGALVKELNERPLGDINPAAIVVDGVGVGNRKNRRTIVWALGITMDGFKVPLSVVVDDQVRRTLAEPAELVSKLVHNLRDRGLDFSDSLWVIDGGRGLRSALKGMTRQRCIIHKQRNVISDHLPPDERAKVGKLVHQRMEQAWAMPDFEQARGHLMELSEWLEQRASTRTGKHRQRLQKAAESVVEGIDETLRLKALGVNDEEVWRAVSNTNSIESVHFKISQWTKRNVTRWLGNMHGRYFVAAIAAAEGRWARVRVERAKLEGMTLAVLKGRHPELELDLSNSSEAVTVDRIGFADADRRKAFRALRELGRWGDRNGKAVEIAPAAVTALDSEDMLRLKRWSKENGFAIEGAGAERRLLREPGGDRSRAAPQRDRLWGLRGTVGDELLVAVGERALELAPVVAEMSAEELAAQAAPERVAEARQSLLSLEADLESWWQGRWDQPGSGKPKRTWQRAAAQIAVRQKEASRGGRGHGHPLAHSRWRVLGAARTRELMREAAYLEGWLSTETKSLGRRAGEIGNPLADLDEFAARLDSAATTLAAGRDLERRERGASVRQRVPAARSAATAAATETPRPKPAATVAEQLRRPLGERRFALFEKAASALAGQLQRDGLGKEALEALRSGKEERWVGHLDAKNISKTHRLEAGRKRDGERLGWVSRERGREARRGQSARAERHHALAGELGEQLQETDRQLQRLGAEEGSLDKFLLEHPDAVLDAAVDKALARQREMELGAEQRPAAVAPAPLAKAAGGIEM